jgi:hypothetical protein
MLPLLRLLQLNTTVVELSIGGNKLGQSAELYPVASALVDLCKENSTLETLDLEWNCLRGK